MKIKLFHKRIIGLALIASLWLASCQSLRVEKSDYTNIRIDSAITLAPDASIEKTITPYRAKLSADMKELLCQSADALEGGRPESPLTNYCSDLVLMESDILIKKKNPSYNVDVAVVNRGGLRVTLPKGDITVETVFELMAVENEIVFLRVKGEILQKFADHIASRGGEGIAGMKFGIKDGKATALTINGQPVNLQSDYWMATSDYVANGGDGSEILAKADERFDAGIRVRDMFIEHFRKMGKANQIIEAKTDGRIYHVE